jgi:hypothetical protein
MPGGRRLSSRPHRPPHGADRSSDHDLALVGNVRWYPGDEFQVVHPLELGAIVAVPVADPSLPFQKGQAVQRQDGPDHVLPDPLGLGLRPGPDPAVDVEAGVTPGENALRPLRAARWERTRRKVGFCVNAGRTLSAQDEDAPRFIFNAGITVTISALKRVVR